VHIRAGNKKAIVALILLSCFHAMHFNTGLIIFHCSPGSTIRCAIIYMDLAMAAPGNSGFASVFHNYSGPGTYNVKLFLTDTNYCNAPDSMVIQLRVAALVKAQFTTPPTGCAPYNAVFNNTP